MWLYPWASGATVAAISAIFIAMGFIPSLQPQLWCCALLTGIALAAFLLFRARKGSEPAVVRP
jgi:L-asparagine transporter-like permease